MKIKKIKLKNKRALLLESELLRVVLAVMCIFLLVILAYKLYSLFIKKTPAEQAKETFNQIVSKINALKEGGNDSYLIVSPANWNLISDGNQLCICSFEGQSASFFRSEKKDNAFQTCVNDGFCAQLKNSISQVDSCGWGAFPSCIDLKTLPLKIYLNKKEGVVSLRTKAEAAIANRLDSILNYKKDENSKTIRELVIDLIAVQEKIEKEGGLGQFMMGSGPFAERDKLHKEINDDFESYLNTINTKKEFDCERNKLGWAIRAYALTDKGELGMEKVSVQKYNSGYSKDISNNQIDLNGYRVILNLNCITS